MDNRYVHAGAPDSLLAVLWGGGANGARSVPGCVRMRIAAVTSSGTPCFRSSTRSLSVALNLNDGAVRMASAIVAGRSGRIGFFIAGVEFGTK
jgi:hypothetical protein